MLIKYWPKETKIPFMRYRYVGVVLSLIMMAASIYLVMTRGLNLGVDFAGGSVVELRQTVLVIGHPRVDAGDGDEGFFGEVDLPLTLAQIREAHEATFPALFGPAYPT